MRFNPTGARNVWVIGDCVVAEEGSGERNDSAKDEEPTPAFEAEMPVEVVVDGSLKVAAKHPGGVAGRVEDGDALGQFSRRVPSAHEGQNADGKGGF